MVPYNDSLVSCLSYSGRVFYRPKELYAFSLAPKDKWQFVGQIDRYSRCRAKIKSYMYAFGANDIDYELWLEISEPKTNEGGKFPRVHCHGLIRFQNNDAVKWFLLSGFRHFEDLGMLCVKLAEDPVRWIDYCQKQKFILNWKPLTDNKDITLFQIAIAEDALEDDGDEADSSHSLEESDSSTSDEIPTFLKQAKPQASPTRKVRNATSPKKKNTFVIAI